MAAVVVMSFNALPVEFEKRAAAAINADFTHYDAARLRKMSPIAALRELRGIRTDKLIVAIGSEAAGALAGPLSIAAAATRARAIYILWPDMRLERLPRVRALSSMLGVVTQSLRARKALKRWLALGKQLEQYPKLATFAQARDRRVLYIDANISLGAAVGGSVGHTAGVIDAFLDLGFEVDYMSVKPMPTERAGARWIQLAPDKLTAMPAELIYYPFADVIEKQARDMEPAARWAFIYQRFSVHSFIGPWCGRQLQLPAVVEFNGSEAWAAENWGARLALHNEAVAAERAAVRAADLCVTVADPLARDLERLGVQPERVLVYPNCVDAKKFNPDRFGKAQTDALRERYGVARDAMLVSFIGTFGQWHGTDFLAERIRNLATSHRDWLDKHKVRFMLIGDGPKMPLVRDILNDESVRGYVTLTGMVAQSEAPAYLACADLLVSPHVPNADGSEFFGSPTKLFEYMAMGRPILASALGQIKDVIAGLGATQTGALPGGAGRLCGLLFEPGDAADFDACFRRLVEDKPLADRLAIAAREEVLARYSWKSHVEAILNRMYDLRLLTPPEDNPVQLKV